jgi:hypothetical protein
MLVAVSCSPYAAITASVNIASGAVNSQDADLDNIGLQHSKGRSALLHTTGQWLDADVHQLSLNKQCFPSTCMTDRTDGKSNCPATLQDCGAAGTCWVNKG